MLQALEGYGASCKRISRAGEEEDCNKDPSAALGMTIRENAPCPLLFIPLREPTSAPTGHLLP